LARGGGPPCLNRKTVADTIYFIFFIPGSLGDKDARECANVLLLRVFRYSDVTGNIFA
jgi:hypothetical protein